MSKYKNILILILLIVAGFLIYGYVKNRPNPPSQQLQTDEITSTNLETQTSEDGGLTIEVTPKNLEPNDQLQFEIKFTTHQDDLNFDLLKQAVLVDDKNKQYSPTSWDGGSGGHHLEGALKFPALDPGTENIRLIIKDIYEIAERKFEWEL